MSRGDAFVKAQGKGGREGRVRFGGPGGVVGGEVRSVAGDEVGPVGAPVGAVDGVVHDCVGGLAAWVDAGGLGAVGLQRDGDGLGEKMGGPCAGGEDDVVGGERIVRGRVGTVGVDALDAGLGPAGAVLGGVVEHGLHDAGWTRPGVLGGVDGVLGSVELDAFESGEVLDVVGLGALDGHVVGFPHAFEPSRERGVRGACDE